MKKYNRENLRNIQTIIQDKTGVVITTDRPWNYRRMATAAAVFVLAVGIVSFPVRAFVTSVVRERMENIPGDEVAEINDMVQSKPTEADEFSREFSASEEERNKALWKAYKDGKFPENVIAQVDNAADATEGMLCYIRSAGVFNLPDREMTDEEILEIIDFQNKMSYAVSQSPASQEALAQAQAEKNQLRRRIEAAGGISEEEAIEIATKRMEADLGERAEGKEILRYQDGSAAVTTKDLSGQTDYEHKGYIAYMVYFENPEDHSFYECTIDTVGGNILYIETNEPMPEE